MLTKTRPDRWEKMNRLGQMATDDIILPRSEPKQSAAPYSIPRNNPGPGIYRSRLPNGKFTNLMQVMFTDFCKMDCHFCPNSHWVPRKRFGFKVDELAKTFNDLVERQTVDGLFLSSGVAGTGTKTTERMVKVVDLIRNKYKFNGYIHLKVMPGTERHIVEAAHLLGTRLSVNLETTTLDHMNKLSKMKHYQRDIMDPMAWIDELKRGPTNGAIGQATQLVVGAADESDLDILNRISQLYADWELKRVYYSPFRPVRYTPLEEHPATPMQRTNRLYQLDWLKRVYGYADNEIKQSFDQGGFPSPRTRPQTDHRARKSRRIPYRHQRSYPRPTDANTGARSYQHRSNIEESTPCQDNSLARTQGHGSSAEMGLAIHHIPRPSSRTRKATSPRCHLQPRTQDSHRWRHRTPD